MIGFSADIDNCVLNAADMTNNPLNCYVTLVLNEVHIREDLVYDKHQIREDLVYDKYQIREDLVYDKHKGHLIGFVDLGNANNKLMEFEAAMNGDTDQLLANSMLGIYGERTLQ